MTEDASPPDSSAFASPPRAPAGQPTSVTATAAASPPQHASPHASRASSAHTSPHGAAATLWRQNTELQRRNKELELEVQGLRAASARRRLSSTLSLGLQPGRSSTHSSTHSSRRASSSVGTATEEDSSAGGAPAVAAGGGAAAAAAQIAALEAQLADSQRGAAAAEAQLAAMRAEAEAAKAAAAEELAAARSTAEAQVAHAHRATAAAEAELATVRAEAASALAAANTKLVAARAEAQCETAAAEERLAEAQAAGTAAAAEAAATRAAAQRRVAAAEEELAAVRAEAAVAEAGVARLSEQLAEARRDAEELRAQLGAVQHSAEQLQEQLEANQASLAAKEEEAARLAAQLQAVEQEAERWKEETALLAGQLADALDALADTRAALTDVQAKAAEAEAAQANMVSLESRVAALLQRPAAAEGSAAGKLPSPGQPRQRSRAASPARYASSAASTRPSSPAEYGSLGGGVLGVGRSASQHSTHIICHNVLLPSPRDASVLSEPEAVVEVVRELEAEVTSLRERLRAAEAELARQLGEKQAAQLELTTLSAEVAALRGERELLQEQAVCLQQEVSLWQCSSLLRDGPSGGEDGPLERSPSRTLTSRMREMLSPRRGVSRSPSSQTSFQPLRDSMGSAASSRVGSRVGSRAGSVSASPLASPRFMETLPEGTAVLAAEAAAAAGPGPLQEGERLWCLQQQVVALEQRLAAKEAQLAEQAAGSAAALAAARREYEGLKEQSAAAEAAAEAVLHLRSSGVGAGAMATGSSAHKECRAAIEGVYAQMWRERLARQKAQAQATELRQQLSARQTSTSAGSGSGSGAVGAVEDVDDALMQSLEAEMARADHLQDELKRHKSHQLKLQKRAEQLELQLAQYTTLLTAAEGLDQLPCLAGASSSPRAGRKSPIGRNASPVQAAITAVQARKAVEEAAALRDQLKTTQSDVASLRRRERESLAALKAAKEGQSELEHKQELLTAGLETLQRLLAKRAQLRGGSQTGRRSAGDASRSPAGKGRESSQLGESAMAVLSALLKTLQTEEGGGAAPAVMVSPQQSEFSCVGIGAASVAGQRAPSMVPSLPPPHMGAAEEAEGLSDPLDPLDISALLPEGSSDGSAALGAAVAAPGPPKDGLASSSALQTLAASGSSRDSTATREGELGGFTIQAVRQQGQGAAAGGQAAVGGQTSATGGTASSRRGSRIPAPPSPAAGAKKGTSPRGRAAASTNSSPSKLSKLLTPCSWIGKHATLSSAAEAGQPGTI